MMEKFIIIGCVLLASAVCHVSSLKCYECMDCATLDTSSLVTCGDTNTTTTTTTTVAPSTNTTNNTNTDGLIKLKANLATTTSITYYCYKSSYIVNGTEKVNRGCLPSIMGITVCPSYTNQTSCSYCNTDKCNGNGASTIKLSFLLLTFITAIFGCKM